LLGAAPPDKIIAEMKPPDYQSVYLDEAVEQIMCDITPIGQLIGIRIGGLSKIVQVKGIKGKVSALLKGAFPSREHLTRFYPVSVSSQKYIWFILFRLGRLMVYYATVLLGLFRRDPSVIKAVQQANRVSVVSNWMFS
jgi:hypothetical protein